VPPRASRARHRRQELADERIGIDVVEVVTGRNWRRTGAEQVRDVVALAVEIRDVGDESALLQQEGAAREIRDPRRSVRGPGFVPGEPLAERSERRAGARAVVGLMNGRVDDEAVQAHRQLAIGKGF
jgi:hypothetical protein